MGIILQCFRYVQYFATKSSPTEHILNLWEARHREESAITDLMNIFRVMGRMDAAAVMEKDIGAWLWSHRLLTSRAAGLSLCKQNFKKEKKQKEFRNPNPRDQKTPIDVNKKQFCIDICDGWALFLEERRIKARNLPIIAVEQAISACWLQRLEASEFTRVKRLGPNIYYIPSYSINPFTRVKYLTILSWDEKIWCGMVKGYRCSLFFKIPGAFLSKPRKERQNEIRAAVPMQYYKAVCRFCCSLYLKCYSKETEREGPKGSNPCVPFYDVIFFCFFLPWLNIMDNFKKNVLHADCDFKEICVTHVHELHCQKILMNTEDKNPLFIFKTFCW